VKAFRDGPGRGQPRPAPAGDSARDAGRLKRSTPSRCPPAAVFTQRSRTAIAPGAGLVTVTCQPSQDQTTLATVSYDLTALAPTANADLDRFAADYPRFLEQWQRDIKQAITASGNHT
jgi:hypothetical protein